MKNTDPVTIFIVDQDELLAMALEHEIEKAFGDRKLDTFRFSSIAACEEALVVKPDVVIIDHSLNKEMPGRKKGVTFIDQLRSNERIHVIVLTKEENPDVVVSSLHHGVHDYVVKNSYMFKKIRLSLMQCFTILELRRNMRTQVALGIAAIIVVFLMFGVAFSLRTLAPATLMIR